MPAAVTDPSGQAIPLPDWHQGGALKTEAEKLFCTARAVMAGAVSQVMGTVSADDETA